MKKSVEAWELRFHAPKNGAFRTIHYACQANLGDPG